MNQGSHLAIYFPNGIEMDQLMFDLKLNQQLHHQFVYMGVHQEKPMTQMQKDNAVLISMLSMFKDVEGCLKVKALEHLGLTSLTGKTANIRLSDHLIKRK